MSRTKGSPNRNGRCADIAAYVADNPGCTAPQIEAKFNIGPHNGLLAYCVRVGKVFRSGRRRFFRYYATEALASANESKNKAEADAIIAATKERIHRQDQLRKRGKRHAEGVKPVHTRPFDGIVRLEPDVRIAGNVKHTIAKAPPGRFEVVGPFVGQITQDWLQRLPPDARARALREAA